MSPLCSEDRRTLLELARNAIAAAVCHARLPDMPLVTGELARPAGAFVTLQLQGQLRGCIGQVEPIWPLAETVAHCAIAAACEDPRFQPVNPEEVAELEIEISILSALEPIRPEAIEVGRHGLLVARGGLRGVLLPQVAAERHWSRERFLQETCRKAGLEPAAWKGPDTRLLAFSSEVFSEADFRVSRPTTSSH